MKNQILMGVAALLISAAVTAQPSQQAQNRNKEKVRTEVKNQPQGPVQVLDQDQYKNRGQAISDQRHARNEERKAMKDQEKARKKQQKQIRKLQKEMEKQHKNMQEQEGVQNREQNMGQERTSDKDQDHGARPAGHQQNAGKPSKGSRQGKK